ncbi:epidermal retinol dehydrogenase 2-like [Ptychodera flava]|uniref:epidermal retinol dehydrogenase 2-like n=1 Tax=Ptychodera flava TaxID=63121 RepID=UPI00396A6346
MCTADGFKLKNYPNSSSVRILKHCLNMGTFRDCFNLALEILVVCCKIVASCACAGFRWLVPLDPKIVRGEIVLVTGAAGWLGRRLALEFARRGAVLVLWDINEDGNEETASEIREVGAEAFTYVCDCSKRMDIYKVATQVKKEVGNISILINNAGTVAGKKFLEMSDDMLKDSINVNMMAHIWTTKAFLPAMLEKNHGHIVNVTSSAGYVAINGLTDYCASKYGAVGLSECLLYELDTLKKDGIHLTNIVPYYFENGLFAGCNTRFSRLFPPLSSERLLKSVMQGVLTNQPMVFIPWHIKPFIIVKTLLPVDAFITLMNFLGVTNFMENFDGKKSR